MKPTTTYSVYYRTGGTDNFQWNLVLDLFETFVQAQDKADEVKAAGYLAYVERTERLERNGLPETYGPVWDAELYGA